VLPAERAEGLTKGQAAAGAYLTVIQAFGRLAQARAHMRAVISAPDPRRVKESWRADLSVHRPPEGGGMTQTPTRCPLKPGGEECGSEKAADGGCTGTISECYNYGNEARFGGFPWAPDAVGGEDEGPRPAGVLSEAVAGKVEMVEGYLVGLVFFKDREEAVAHATAEAFKEWYTDHPVSLLGADGGRPGAEAVLEWLRENRHAVRQVLGVLA
jgi:hypothetical protein